MESLVEAFNQINLNYALPVAGVVALLVLVFAFGFKSPAQLPAFSSSGSADDDRKGKKSKKSSKKSSQNGQAALVSELATSKQHDKSNAKQATSPKAKNSKAANQPAEVTKNNNKVDIKNKKNEKNEKNAQKKKKEEILNKKGPAGKPITKEAESGEWVQLLSRKEKKSRKKEADGDGPKEVSGSSKEGTPEKKRSAQPNSKENSPNKPTTARKDAKKGDVEVKNEPVKPKDNTKKVAEKENVKPAAKVTGSPEVKKNKSDEKSAGGVIKESGDAATKKKKARRDQ